MSKTGAERQAAYRARRPFEGEGNNGERRLSTWVTTGASLALERLARRAGVSRRQVLERLLMAADDEVLASFELNSPEWKAYFAQPKPRP